MVWIALNLKGKHEGRGLEVIEGLEIDGSKYKVHPKLLDLGRSLVPTIKHSRFVISGSTACIEYIDKEFGRRLPIKIIP